MGLLVRIVHEVRLTEASEIAALFRALGEDEVSLRARCVEDATQVDRLVRAMPRAKDATIGFSGGRLAGAAIDSLAALVLADAWYVDVRARPGSPELPGVALRVWQDRAWVEAGDGCVVSTERRELALEAFRRQLGAALEGSRGVVSGHVTAPGARAVAPLLRWLRQTGACVDDASVELGLADAATLASSLSPVELRWVGEAAEVEQPGGGVSTYLLWPVDPVVDAEWRRRISAAIGSRS
jgi:hypothetical protein